MLFLSPGIVYWLQALLHWCDNIAVFIADVSRRHANSIPQRYARRKIKAHTHTHCISDYFQSGTRTKG